MRNRIESPGILELNGEVKLYNRTLFRSELKGMVQGKSEPLKIIVTVKKQDDNISNQQRRYFYGVVVYLLVERFNDFGNRVTVENVVLWLKDNFLFREKFDKITGKIIKEHISLSSNEKALTKEEFQKAKEEIQQYAAEKLELEIPDPNQHYSDNPQTQDIG